MNHSVLHLIFRIGLLAAVILLFTWVFSQTFSATANLLIIIAGVLLVFPVVCLGRVILDRNPTPENAVWVTTFVHYGVAAPFGCAIIRAILTHSSWTVWTLPIPTEVGYVLCIVTGVPCILSVANLALRGLGAPFAIALSQRLAVDWMYAWVRNPMVLSTLVFLLSLGIWFQSAGFVLWALFLFTPALLFFVKVYEERELSLRFGQSYLDYKAKTPMLFPRKPRA
jgi:protein-S-isoprenylcysteine O-methyltransferase Ste14